MEIDETDKAILSRLRDDCRITNEKLAKELNLHKNTVKARIKKLEENNIILGYITNVNFERLGYKYGAVIFASLEGTGIGFDDVSRVVQIPETEGAVFITGSYPVLLGVNTKSFDKIQEIVNEIGQYDFISDVKYDMIVKRYETGGNFNPFRNKTVRRKEYPPEMLKLTEIDHKIIESIKNDAKKPFTRIASELDISLSTVKTRINKMEKYGVITGCSALLNWQALGFTEMALVRIKFNPFFKKDGKEIIAKLLQRPEILSFASTSGNFDVMSLMLFENKQHLGICLHEINKIPGMKLIDVNIAYYFFSGRHAKYPLL